MPVTELDHYFVRVSDLETSRAFYCDVLGLEVMDRPDLPFHGYWLGMNGKVRVHMGPHGIPNSELYYLGTGAGSSTRDSGVIDHIAFVATEPERFSARFESLGLPVRRRYLSAFGLYQMFVRDPDGLTIELNFHGIADEPQWAEGGEDYADMPRVE